MAPLDDPLFSLNEVARLLGISDTKLLSNWTERGLCDPHTSLVIPRRGRGRQRSFSTRDLLRFALMKDLADRYAVPVPLGARICESVLGNFNPENFGIFIVNQVKVNSVSTQWCAGPKDLARLLSGTFRHSALVVTTEGLSLILKKAEDAVRAKCEEISNGQ